MYIIQRYIVFLQCSLQLLSYCWSSLPLWYILFAHCCIWAGVALSHAHALKIVSHFLYNSLLLQSISKHTNVAYIWRDTTSIYTWYISLVYCCIFCTLHPSTPHLFDCCIIMIGVQCQTKVSSDIIWWCMSNGSIVYWCGRRMLYNNNRMVIRGWNGVAAAMAWSLQ